MVFPYLGKVGRFCYDDPHFLDFDLIGSLLYVSTQSDLIILFFAEKNQFVFITFSSRDTCT